MKKAPAHIIGSFAALWAIAFAMQGIAAGRCDAAVEANVQPVLRGTERYVGNDDLVLKPIAEWDAFLLGQIAKAKEGREKLWHRDDSSVQAYERSVEPNRERLRARLGVIDARILHPQMELVGASTHPGSLAATSIYEVWAVRWSVMSGVNAEGLMLKPRQPSKGTVIVLPDAGQAPEMLAGLVPGVAGESQVARRLAEAGMLVIVPTLVNRESNYTGDELLGIVTNQTHREWIYRQATVVGRHVIGYEIQKVLAAVDWIKQTQPAGKVGLVGYGEGGLLALNTAALDSRIETTWVSGYFGPRERVWMEPIYRNIWGSLEEFGDAETATLVAPRALIIEPSRGPEVPSAVPLKPSREPGKVVDGRALRSAAPGAISSPSFNDVKSEWERARSLMGAKMSHGLYFTGGDSKSETLFGSSEAIGAFLKSMAVQSTAANVVPFEATAPPDPDMMAERQHRTVIELQNHVQALVRRAEWARNEGFWSKLKPTDANSWSEQILPFRKLLAEDVIGDLAVDSTPLRPRSRLIPEYSNDKYAVYQVLIDAAPGVTAWGYLLLPNTIKAGERRPVIVFQHGANGVPSDTFDPASKEFSVYQAYAARLATEGLVVFAPYIPNTIAGDSFSQLQRKANPLRKSVFSIQTAIQKSVLHWLQQQSFVDDKQIAFYGISYGGKTVMRVVPQLKEYCLAIAAANFGDSIADLVSVNITKGRKMFNPNYEVFDFNLANTFNDAELAALIAPRPFMVERGYKDHPEQLDLYASEYAKAQRLYFSLGIPERTAVEYFEGGHTENGRGTLDFLRKHLHWSNQ